MNAIEFFEARLDFETDSADLAAMLRDGVPVTLVDGRSRAAWEQETLPGALSLPHRTITAETTAHLPKETLIVTFCHDIGCNASFKTALKLARLGFHVKALPAGLAGWKQEGYPTHRAGVPVSTISCDC